MKYPRYLVILSLLSSIEEAYGISLVKASKGNLVERDIYVQLDVLCDAGLVASRYDFQCKEDHPKRLFRITERGSSYFNEFNQLSII